jgi:hypothetical protein
VLNRVQKFARLSWAERWLLIRACMMLLLTVVALRLVGFRRWYAVLARRGPNRESVPGQQAEILVEKACATIQRMAAVAAQGRHHANCLERSLVLWWLLRRLGIASDLRIGLHRDADRLEAHAWVEHGGLALNEADDVQARFAAFDRAILPRAPGCP